MVIRRLLACLVLVAAGLLAGCGGDDDPSPFQGDWVSATAGRLSFDDTKWWDGEGDSGKFTYWGDYPDFTVRFSTNTEQIERSAAFRDVKTFVLCEKGLDGATGDCHEFVQDDPTLH